ncbi:glutaredoxin family protein [Methanohalophilus levihalophilus]|uniref:glutaredoxin family protein n=1 Tax=Methanohalophilus levihalophilus TaxID=1431282 RepID=UPI001AE2E14F|nr:thioredoxin family protein [Methanohalophilus levihalophilus]
MLLELYYSDTCPNCHYVRKQIVDILPGGIMFKEINISGSEGAERARQLGIEEVPTIAIDGEVVLIGRVDKDDIEQEINSFL